MGDLTGKELELALTKQLRRERTPVEKLVDKVENHIIETDAILQALVDVAERGREEMEAEVSDRGARFNVIRDLLEQYRERHSDFIKLLYLEKKKAA
ncbi:MAG: hypothetical protein WC978_00180 [bacterium]